MSQELMQYLYHFFFENFVKQGLMVTIACYVIGSIIKTSMPKISNQLIVPILTLCGIVLALIMIRPEQGEWFITGIRGMVMGWAATGFHELLRTAIKLHLIKIPGVDLEAWFDKHSETDKPVKKEDNKEAS